MNKKVVLFGKPELLISPISEIGFYFPFTIADDERSERKKIKVSVSRSLAMEMGFEIWREKEYYQELTKLLYPTVKKIVINKIKDNGIENLAELFFNVDNFSIEKPTAIDDIEEFDGAEFIIESLPST